MGYILGNKEARDGCVSLLKQASNVIDKNVKDIVYESWRNSGLAWGNKCSAESETAEQFSASEQDNCGQSPSGTRYTD